MHSQYSRVHFWSFLLSFHSSLVLFCVLFCPFFGPFWSFLVFLVLLWSFFVHFGQFRSFLNSFQVFLGQISPFHFYFSTTVHCALQVYAHIINLTFFLPAKFLDLFPLLAATLVFPSSFLVAIFLHFSASFPFEKFSNPSKKASKRQI